MKNGLWVGDDEGLVAENEIMGTRAFSPRSITNFACVEVCGPIIACTCSSFISCKAAYIKYALYMFENSIYI